MAAISTQATVLHSFPYGETSKIVRLATRDYGVVSAIAKGALREKSPFGARLQLMSEGTAQLYMKQSRDLQTLAEFDIERQREDLARDLTRFASASALAELILRFSPQEPQPQIYELLTTKLDALADADPRSVPQVSLGAMWLVVCALGFTPSLADCVLDGRPIDADGKAHFSAADGGYVCKACAVACETAQLGPQDRAWLEAFVSGADAQQENSLTRRHAGAHRRLVSRFIRFHVSEGRELPALHFWETLPWGDMS